MKNIIRVFPEQSNFLPKNSLAFVGSPPKGVKTEGFCVHVCCVFTWDKGKCEALRDEWQEVTSSRVLLDGPAYGNSGGDFIPGLYVARGITFTSRGCPKHCSGCFVPEREGKLRELPIRAGNIIMDNNFLACNRAHREKVFAMLTTQTNIEFRGSLDADLLDDYFVERARGADIKSLYLSCDTDCDATPLKRAVARLKRGGFSAEQLYCFVLIGLETVERDGERLLAVYDTGCYPWPQLYQPPEGKEYDGDYQALAAFWRNRRLVDMYAGRRSHVQGCLS
jgi:hypothetical protein